MIPLFLAVVAMAELWPMRWPASAPPEALDLLKGTPVNCILVEDPSPALAAAASQRGLKLLKVQGEQLLGPGGMDVHLTTRRAIHWESKDPVIGTSEGVWPGIEIEHGGKTMTGPTSAPWVFTNSGFLRYARASTDADFWIAVRPPPGNLWRPERYIQAIADAAICGAKWIIALDDHFQDRLIRHDAGALKDWAAITQALSFYKDHMEAKTWREWSQFGVIQDPATGALLTGSLLDMLESQRTSIRSIPSAKLGPDALAGIKIVLNVSGAAIPANAGVQVLEPPPGWHFPVVPESDFMMGRKQLDEMQPLWEMTYKATLRKNFGVRTFNTSGVMSSAVAAPDTGTLIVHLVNYTDFPADNLTVHALGEWKRAELLEPGGKVRQLELYPVSGGSGVDIESLASVGIVRFER